MAASNFKFFVFVDGVETILNSKNMEVILKTLALSSDGGSTVINLKEVSGHFDFDGKNITNVANVDGVDVSTLSTNFSAHVNGGDNKHDASEIDFEDLAVTGKNVTADDLEATITALDDAIGDRSNYSEHNYITNDQSVAASLDALDVEVADKLDLGGGTLTGFLTLHADPTSNLHAVTKQYADNIASGIDAKPSVKAATTVVGGNVTLSGEQTIDGVSLVDGDRVLVKNQTDLSENGIYEVDTSTWARVSDLDTWNEHVSAYVWVEQGTTNGDTGWVCTVDAGGTLETTDITWTQFTGSAMITAGAGLTKTGNTIDVGAGNGITVNADDITVKADTTGGANLAKAINVSSNGVAVKVDDSTIEGDATSGQLKVKDGGVTGAKLAAAVAGNGLMKDGSSNIAIDYDETLTNDSGVTVAARDIVYVKANGNIAKAQADTASIQKYRLGISTVEILDSASGKVRIKQHGKVGGFTGLTANAPVYLAHDTAGGYTQDVSDATGGFTNGDAIIQIGWAVSTTEIELNRENVGVLGA